MNDPLISVIVPVYKVELYLKRCVDSLLQQTYQNLEIILVDDGSPDTCPAICDAYAKENSRIVAIHKENGGQSAARNAGLAIAKGEYIGFIDSDDWVSQDMYAYCMRIMHEYDADAAQIDFIMTEHGDATPPQTNEHVDVYSGKDILQYYMATTTTTTGSYSVCRCLFTVEALNSIKFREGKINEDIDYKYKVLSRCNRFAVSNKVYYFYFQSGNSTTTGGLQRKDFDLYDAANELELLTQNESYGTIRKLGDVKKARTAFSLLCRIAFYGIADNTLEKEDVVRQLTAEHRRNLKALLKSPMRLSRKTLAVFLATSYPLTERIVFYAKHFKK